jgi:hypothetical protein
MPRKSDLSKYVLNQLQADDEVLKGIASRYRKALLKEFTATLTQVLKEYETRLLDYDTLIEIKLKIGTRLLSLSAWSTHSNALNVQIKSYSASVYKRSVHAKERLLAEELSDAVNNLRAAGLPLSCGSLAEMDPRAYMLLKDVKL